MIRGTVKQASISSGETVVHNGLCFIHSVIAQGGGSDVKSQLYNDNRVNPPATAKKLDFTLDASVYGGGYCLPVPLYGARFSAGLMIRTDGSLTVIYEPATDFK